MIPSDYKPKFNGFFYSVSKPMSHEPDRIKQELCGVCYSVSEPISHEPVSEKLRPVQGTERTRSASCFVASCFAGPYLFGRRASINLLRRRQGTGGRRFAPPSAAGGAPAVRQDIAQPWDAFGTALVNVLRWAQSPTEQRPLNHTSGNKNKQFQAPRN